MKQHLIVKLRALPATGFDPPQWQRFIFDKSRVVETLTPAFDALLQSLGVRFWVTREYELMRAEGSPLEAAQGLERTFRVIFQQDVTLPPDLTPRVAALPGIEEARLIAVVETPLPVPQLSLRTSLTQRAGDLIHLPYAHALTRGDPKVTIAVLDTGVDSSHPELVGKVGSRKDFVNLTGLDTSDFVGDFLGLDDAPDDEVGHGTHVSGIIAAKGLRMEEGVAPECKLMAVRVLATMERDGKRFGAGIVDNINTGIKYAVDQGADVINMSLGIRHMGGGLPHEDVIRYAVSKDVTVVAASGNDGTAERYYPGALDGVWAVGATDEQGELASFSSYGARISLVAPGSRVFSAFASGGYAHASGTSQASPFVAGSMALLKSFARQRGARLSNGDLADIVRHTCERSDSRMRSPRSGYGLLNLADAFKYLNHQLTGSTTRIM
ncbi:MAG: S8 family serine peptidase [Novosphingobium sp.]|nr:S8 family serine peptidase [Novosphingobium sp.]